MIEDIIKTIKKDFPEEKVCEILDEEILNWVEEDWQDEFDNEYDWYSTYGHGEAEQVVINHMIDRWTDKYNHGKKLNKDIFLEVYEKIKEEYDPFL